MGIKTLSNPAGANLDVNEKAAQEIWELDFVNTGSAAINIGDIVILDVTSTTGTGFQQLPANAAANLFAVGVCTRALGLPIAQPLTPPTSVAVGAKGSAVVYGPVAKVNMEAGGTDGEFVLATNATAGRGTGNAAPTLGATVGILTSAVTANVASMFVKPM